MKSILLLVSVYSVFTYSIIAQERSKLLLRIIEIMKCDNFDSAYQLASPKVTFNTNRTKKLY